MPDSNIGGFIGQYKPSGTSPSGIYTLQAVYNQIAASKWPGQPSLDASPPYETGNSNGQYDNSGKKGYWNNEKGFIVSDEDIFTTSSRRWDQTSGGGDAFRSSQSATLFSSIPATLWWVYVVVIGGGGGGDGNGNGDGGGGGGWAWAKLDLRNYSGASMTCTTGKGGNQYGNGGSTTFAINGTTVLSAGGGLHFGSGGTGGSGSVTSHASVIRSLTKQGGAGKNNAQGGTGGTGGGGGGPSNGFGGNANRPFGGAGAGNDGGGFKGGGTQTTVYSSSIYQDPDRNNAVWITQNQAHSAVNSFSFFNGSSASNWNDGKDGRNTTGSPVVQAGTFGSGGGGSGSGSGYGGGPGAVIVWWS